MPTVSIPTPPDLDHDPEFAVLAVLEAALLAAEFTLIAQDPLLRDPSAPIEPSRVHRHALVLVNLAAKMHRAIHVYRGTVSWHRRHGLGD